MMQKDKDRDESIEFAKGDRIEWRKQNGASHRGTVIEFDSDNDALIVVGDVPTGEPSPILWGPEGIFTRIG